MVPVPFMVAAVAYGLYVGKALPMVVGLVSLVLYALSLRREEGSIKLTGLVGMFSSILALWENQLRYLALVGVILLVILEFSAEMRRREIKKPIKAQS